MKLTQEAKVINQLKQYGYVTNVWAFQHQILRLGAIIKKLRDKGYKIDGDYISGTKNWRYELIETAKKKIYIYDLGEDGVRRPREVMVPV